KYIVDNTIGKLCEEKKQELSIVEEDYLRGKKGRKKETIKQLETQLTQYREWLLQITIVDPACGSGAFLNQALEFLIREHRWIDEMTAKLFGGGLVFQDVENSILENNLYGVDINEESVEIAKLSLWLRTAQKGRKLTSLNNNIKCGNSLIDDPEVAGDKAFKWEEEFPKVFPEKQKKAFHITWVTHNSRTSQRMMEYKVSKGNGVWLTDEMEVEITKTIIQIVEEDKLNVMAYNICGDHVHILLVCEEDEIPNIVRKMKSKSAIVCNKLIYATRELAPLQKEGADDKGTSSFDTSGLDQNKGTSSLVTDGDEQLQGSGTNKKGKKLYNPLWAQKYSKTYIEDEEKLYNTITYIANNRTKHNLPLNKGLQPLVTERQHPLYCSYDYAFRPEYNGGFDVVIGNPPYGAKLDVNIQKWLAKRYIKGGSETAISFIKLGYEILREYGRISYIIPKSFSFSSNYKSIREFLLNDLDEVIDCKKVWNEVKLEQIIFSCSKSIPIRYYNSLIRRNENFVEVGQIDKSTFKQFGFLLNGISDNELSIGIKLISNNVFLNDIATNSRGIIVKNLQEKGNYSVIGGKEIDRFGIRDVRGFLDEMPANDKAIITNNSILVQGIVAHILNPYEHIKITACIPNKQIDVLADNINQLTLENEDYQYYVWCLLNSQLINWFSYLFIYGRAIRTMRFDNPVTSRIPIPKNNNNISTDIVKLSKDYLKMYNDIEEKSLNFLNLLQSKYEIDKLSTKLQNWFVLDFKQFIAELKKKKVVLTLSEEAEWMSYFNEKKAEAQELKAKIEATDNEIDLMVYKLYDLTYDEVLIVDPATSITREVYGG
ncbi:MAG: N-6 DNA methylase, partial [Ignavibacteriae bacterium]|nr:N-6 DNA methylase [Ignavibacteriota bacterium]